MRRLHKLHLQSVDDVVQMDSLRHFEIIILLRDSAWRWTALKREAAWTRKFTGIPLDVQCPLSGRSATRYSIKFMLSRHAKHAVCSIRAKKPHAAHGGSDA